MIRNMSSHLPLGYKCMVAILVLIMVVFLGILGWVFFDLINSIGVIPTKTVITPIEAKQVVSAHGPILPIISIGARSESYILHFRIDENQLKFAVEKEFFDSIKIGDNIRVDYGFGRLSGSREPVKIRPMLNN